MAQKITDRVQRDSVLNETRGKVMAQIVPAKTGDRCALEQLFPRGPKSCGYDKEARCRSCSVAPMRACMMRLLEWEAESRAVTGRAYKRATGRRVELGLAQVKAG